MAPKNIFIFILVLSCVLTTSSPAEQIARTNPSGTSDAVVDPCVIPKNDDDCLPNGVNACVDKEVNTCDPNVKRKTGAQKTVYKICREDQAELDNFERTFHPPEHKECDRGGAAPNGFQEKTLARIQTINQLVQSGGLTTAADFSAAAVVYVHSHNPADDFQAYRFEKKAMALGDRCHRRFAEYGLHWYLERSNQSLPGGCSCYVKPSGATEEEERDLIQEFACGLRAKPKKSVDGKNCLTRECPSTNAK
jgi:hypothetical protein